MTEDSLTHDVHRHPDGQTVTATVAGDWTALADEALLAELHDALDEGYRNVIVDAAALTFVDSTSLGRLVGLHQEAVERGGWLRVVSPPNVVRRPMTLTGLDQVFEVTPDREAG
ncbi:STAS domain-containing protein [Cryptosporangium phraense]|uniref:STAS domain-containing protein n=1 Tax=Cryptosporangium phraense TaxID=2593070 RepID=A0A545AEB5_9ACTN|nr:STAS domain-containing protein [Cryptosporangium phraense]TQS39653.1 STAS domain-containing protein [Cryptosporangium phraense]